MSPTKQKTYLNLGCGHTYDSGWRNLDINPVGTDVEKWEAQLGIPASTGSVDAVYHSHLLEHLSQLDGETLLQECFRVLKPKGILRIAVPDLEQICHEYLKALSRVDQNQEDAHLDAYWMRLELTDQMTRDRSGGQMLDFLRSKPSNKSFIIERCGEQVRPLLGVEDGDANSSHKSESLPLHLHFKQILKKCTNISTIKNFLNKIFLNASDYTALQYGRFYFSGELHKHMYDRVSLEELLLEIGFTQVTAKSHTSSQIPNWASYCLDITKNNRPRKPDSLYIETIKPK